MKTKVLVWLTFFITIITICTFFFSAFALEPEELTNVTVTDEYGRTITVEYYWPTQRWQALADGAETIYSGLAPNANGMWLCKTGVVDFNYTGFAGFQGETWYVENGKVNTDYSGVQEHDRYAYTIENGKVVEKDYTSAEKRKMAAVVGGFFAFIALIIALKIRDKKQKKKHDEQFQELLQKSAENNRRFEEFERQQRIEKAKAVYKEEVTDRGLSYKQGTFLTNREKAFYPYLKEVADNLGLTVSMKPRLGDLVTGADSQFTSLGMKERTKVQQKHVDFALFDPETMKVMLLVELDDTTHDRQKRVNRDVFVDNVLEGTGYKILHVRDEIGLEEAVRNKLEENEVNEDG